MPDKEITVFPGLLPEESITGYLQRTCTLNRAVISRGYFQLRGVSSVTSGFAFPANLERLVEQAVDVFKSADHLASHHTLEPLFAWTLSEHDLKHLQRWQRTGGKALSVRMKGNALGQEYSRHCPICAEEDVRRFGVPYWRRVTQLAFVAVCPVHDVPLLGGCGVCLQADLFASSWPLPSKHCACGRPQLPVISGELVKHKPLLHRLAQMAQQLLLRDAPANIKSASPKVCRAAAAAQGFIANRGISPLGISRAIETKGGFEAMVALKVQIGMSRARASITEGQSFQTIVFHLLLLDLLFGSIDKYVEHCKALELTSPELEQCHIVSDGQIQKWRARLSDVLQSNPGITRSRLNRIAAHSMARLRQFDNAWLDARVSKQWSKAPTEKRRAVWEARSHRTDVRAAADIRKRADDLLNAPGQPRRLGRSALILGSRAAISSYRSKTVGPIFAQALAERVESTEQFKRRCLKWALENPSAFGSLQMQLNYVGRHANVSQPQARELIESHRLAQAQR